MRDIILFFSILEILIAEDPTDMDSFITDSGDYMDSFFNAGSLPANITTAPTTSTKSNSNSTTTNTDTTTYTIEKHRGN